MTESISFCRMHNAVGMFGRRVDREQFQSYIASVSESMFRSGRHSKHIARPDIMHLPSHDHLSPNLPIFDSVSPLDSLIRVWFSESTLGEHGTLG